MTQPVVSEIEREIRIVLVRSCLLLKMVTHFLHKYQQNQIKKKEKNKETEIDEEKTRNFVMVFVIMRIRVFHRIA